MFCAFVFQSLRFLLNIQVLIVSTDIKFLRLAAECYSTLGLAIFAIMGARTAMEEMDMWIIGFLCIFVGTLTGIGGYS